MKHSGVMLSRKPYAKSFLLARTTVVSCRVGNHAQTVSCRYESHCRCAGQETIRKKFPVVMKHHSLTTDRKLFSHILARSFFSHQEKKKVRRMATVQ